MDKLFFIPCLKMPFIWDRELSFMSVLVLEAVTGAWNSGEYVSKCDREDKEARGTNKIIDRG